LASPALHGTHPCHRDCGFLFHSLSLFVCWVMGGRGGGTGTSRLLASTLLLNGRASMFPFTFGLCTSWIDSTPSITHACLLGNAGWRPPGRGILLHVVTNRKPTSIRTDMAAPRQNVKHSSLAIRADLPGKRASCDRFASHGSCCPMYPYMHK